MASTLRFVGTLTLSKDYDWLKMATSLPVPEEPLTSGFQSSPAAPGVSGCMLGAPMLGCIERPAVTALLAPESTSYGPWLKTTEINSGKKGR